MDVQSLANSGAVDTTRWQPQNAATTGGVDGFAATLATAQADPGAAVLETAEDMVGQIIQAPPGGCSCEALATKAAGPAATNERPPTLSASSLLSPPSAPSPLTAQSLPTQSLATQSLASSSLLAMGRAAPTTPTTVQPGDLLAFSRAEGGTHFGIAVDASTMVAPDSRGLVSMLPINWDQVRAARRLGR